MEQSESTLGNQRKHKASISHYFLERRSSRNIKIVNTKYKLSLRIGVFSMSNSLLNLSNFFLRIFLTFYLPSLYENALVSPILSPSPKSYCSFKLISLLFTSELSGQMGEIFASISSIDLLSQTPVFAAVTSAPLTPLPKLSFIPDFYPPALLLPLVNMDTLSVSSLT